MRKTFHHLPSPLVIAGLILFFTMPSAWAVIIDERPYRNLVQEAALIIRGEVTETLFRSGQNPGGGEPLPYTFVSIRIEETLKGRSENPERIVLRVPGGLSEDGEQVSVLAGSPRFDVGDTGVFFIRRDPETGRAPEDPLVGLKQGFTRFNPDGSVVNELAYEPLLSSDPALAARLHPREIRDYAALAERLKEPRNAAERSLARYVSEAALMLMEDPEAWRELSSAQWSMRMSDDRARGIEESGALQDRSLKSLLQTVLPGKFQVQLRSPLEAMLYRDLNHALFEVDLFPVASLEGIELRPEVRRLAESDPRAMDLPMLLKRNRRILEELFPGLVYRSLDETLIVGRYRPLPSIMTTEYGPHTYRMNIVALPESEGENPVPGGPPAGKALSRQEFLSHLRTMVRELHTASELEALPAVESADAEAAFTATFHPPVATPPTYNFEPDADEDDESRRLQENRGNPVIDQ